MEEEILGLEPVLDFFDRKMGVLICKLPLVIIAAPKFFYSEWTSGIGDSKHYITLH